MFDFIFDRSIIAFKHIPLPTFTTNGGAELPLIGIGTSEIGGYWHGAHPYIDDYGDIDQLRHSLAKGSNYIDTCLMYGDGHTVELVAKAIKNVPRSDLFINAKLTRVGGVELKDIREVEEQCDRYLRVLGTDCLDQFQIHSRKSLGRVPEMEVVQKIGELISAGKVKHWGVSNYNKQDLHSIAHLIKEPLHSNEIPYGVFMRDYEQNGTLKYMQQNNITTIAFFTVRKGGLLVDSFFNTDVDTLLQQLAKKYKRTPTQVAINWVTHHPRTMALIKSTNGTHVNENMASVGWEMQEEDYELITSLKG
jgi:diketogulonate reductase-like aldo/keto reductase